MVWSLLTRTLLKQITTITLCIFTAPLLTQVRQIPDSTPPTFEQVTNKLVQPYFDQRRAAVAAVQTRQAAEARQAIVRATLLKLLDGLPEDPGPLNATVVGSIQQDGFRIERILYDSLPGYHVTANLYLPATPGPAPAIIYHSGHGPFGKIEAFGLASNLARNGIATLAYDPLGAGERLQVINPATGKSWAGADEHSQAQIPISLIGDHVARYMLNDAMRAIDYLATRPEINSSRIGSYGCSGGGTLSAYLIALDPRVKAGAVACYLTTYEQLYKTIGPQDGEQVIPSFIKDGLDLPDLIELAAPRPYAQLSTTEDMFPFAGATAAHEEAARFYSLVGAPDNLKFLTGPGRHGAVRPLFPQMIAFFEKAFNMPNPQPPTMVTLKPPPPEDLRCTTTGQVTTALLGRTIYQINQERAAKVLPRRQSITTQRALAALQTRLKQEIPTLTGMSITPQLPPELTVLKTDPHPSYQLQTITFHSRSGLLLPALLALPDKPGRKAALLLTTTAPIESLGSAGSQLDRAAQSGQVVLAITPLPWPKTTEQDKPTLGATLPWTSRALLLGKTFVGLRAEDTLAAVQWLASQRTVDSSKIDAYADGPAAVALLHAALFEPRIRRITIEHSLSTYHSVLETAVHRGISETVIPGVLLHYDLDELMIALSPRPISLIDPIDASGAPLTASAFHQQFSAVESASRALATPNRVTLTSAPKYLGP